MIRRQLPAYSPISMAALVRAAGAALRDPEGVVEALRTHLEDRFEADWAFLTGSGTHALQLALQSLDPPPTDDEPVAMPAYSCFDLVTAAVGAGAAVRFYDVDPATLSPDPASLERVIDGGCRAVVGANLFGFPVDWDLLGSAAAACGAVLIEDAAQGLGATWRDREFGRFGDLTVLSFGRGKGWTGGGGGALLGRGRRSSGPPHSARGLPSAPRTWDAQCFLTLTATWALGRPALYRIPTAIPPLALGETRYEEPTRPARIGPLSAAATLRHQDESFATVEARRRRAAEWDRVFAADLAEPSTPVDRGRAGYLRYPVLVESAARARRLARAGRDEGVAAAYPLALTELPVLRGSPAATSRFAGAACLVERLITVPTHPRTTRLDLSRVGLLLQESGDR